LRVGKTTIISDILEKNENFELSISYTTRKMRDLEKDGVKFEVFLYTDIKYIYE